MCKQRQYFFDYFVNLFLVWTFVYFTFYSYSFFVSFIRLYTLFIYLFSVFIIRYFSLSRTTFFIKIFISFRIPSASTSTSQYICMYFHLADKYSCSSFLYVYKVPISNSQCIIVLCHCQTNEGETSQRQSELFYSLPFLYILALSLSVDTKIYGKF